jgi:hypothetical protein
VSRKKSREIIAPDTVKLAVSQGRFTASTAVKVTLSPGGIPHRRFQEDPSAKQILCPALDNGRRGVIAAVIEIVLLVQRREFGAG